ncbi:hypothetical protein BDQ17DRAFT_1416194 [Cyathus striatus]|nr:hypothetical protein BDQ17DRAFT_1416194 [Cyathus striatus]
MKRMKSKRGEVKNVNEQREEKDVKEEKEHAKERPRKSSNAHAWDDALCLLREGGEVDFKTLWQIIRRRRWSFYPSFEDESYDRLGAGRVDKAVRGGKKSSGGTGSPNVHDSMENFLRFWVSAVVEGKMGERGDLIEVLFVERTESRTPARGSLEDTGTAEAEALLRPLTFCFLRKGEKKERGRF